jgi:ribose-phosphate pyrophosphokinase
MIKVNGEEIKFETFPNGETRIVEESYYEALDFGNVVSFKYENDSDLIKLMFVKKLLDTTHEGNPNHLIIYYMPYSRMDRSENDSPFTLKYVTEFINGLNFDSVEVIEPHSDVTVALLDRAKANYINFELIEAVKEEVGFNNDTDYIVFPDTGASKRYSKMLAKNVLIGHKIRNFQTGEITSLQLIGEGIGGKKAIIVDDLSSYGGTFIKTADALDRLGVEEVYLLVAHAENSIFKGELFYSIDKVFTTDSILTEQGNRENAKFKNQLHIFKLEGENV